MHKKISIYSATIFLLVLTFSLNYPLIRSPINQALAADITPSPITTATPSDTSFPTPSPTPDQCCECSIENIRIGTLSYYPEGSLPTKLVKNEKILLEIGNDLRNFKQQENQDNKKPKFKFIRSVERNLDGTLSLNLDISVKGERKSVTIRTQLGCRCPKDDPVKADKICNPNKYDGVDDNDATCAQCNETFGFCELILHAQCSGIGSTAPSRDSLCDEHTTCDLNPTSSTKCKCVACRAGPCRDCEKCRANGIGCERRPGATCAYNSQCAEASQTCEGCVCKGCTARGGGCADGEQGYCKDNSNCCKHAGGILGRDTCGCYQCCKDENCLPPRSDGGRCCGGKCCSRVGGKCCLNTSNKNYCSQTCCPGGIDRENCAGNVCCATPTGPKCCAADEICKTDPETKKSECKKPT